MTKFTKIVAHVFVLCMCLGIVTVQAQKKKKEKKEKKPFEWVMPALTENKNFDTYLLTCDTLYREINQYCENIVFYSVKPIDLTDANGNVLVEKGDTVRRYMIVDTNNHVRGSSEVLIQLADIILTGSNLLLDMADITTQTALAAAELPNLGLNALTYGKYVKAGPKIVAMGMNEIKEIIASCKAQARSIKAYKKSFTESGELIDPTADISKLEGLDIADVEPLRKPSEEMLAEVEALKKANAEAGEVNEDAFDEVVN